MNAKRAPEGEHFVVVWGFRHYALPEDQPGEDLSCVGGQLRGQRKLPRGRAKHDGPVVADRVPWMIAMRTRAREAGAQKTPHYF